MGLKSPPIHENDIHLRRKRLLYCETSALGSQHATYGAKLFVWAMNSRDHSTKKPDKSKLRRQQTAGKCPGRLFVFVSQPASIIRGLSGNSLATWSYLPYSVRSELINTSRVKIHFKPLTPRVSWDLLNSSFDSGNLQLVLGTIVVGWTVLASC